MCIVFALIYQRIAVFHIFLSNFFFVVGVPFHHSFQIRQESDSMWIYCILHMYITHVQFITNLMSFNHSKWALIRSDKYCRAILLRDLFVCLRTAEGAMTKTIIIIIRDAHTKMPSFGGRELGWCAFSLKNRFWKENKYNIFTRTEIVSANLLLTVHRKDQKKFPFWKRWLGNSEYFTPERTNNDADLSGIIFLYPSNSYGYNVRLYNFHNNFVVSRNYFHGNRKGACRRGKQHIQWASDAINNNLFLKMSILKHET